MARYKQTIGIGVAAVILAAVFVPFQQANAATLNVSVPAEPIPKSTKEFPFTIILEIAPGEVISIARINVIIDGDILQDRVLVFDPAGHRISGTPAALVKSLTVSAPVTPGYGYGYGYGYGDADSGNGVVGPAKITISGMVKTDLLIRGNDPATHTIQVTIDTGTGSPLASSAETFTIFKDNISGAAGGSDVDEIEALEQTINELKQELSLLKQQVNANEDEIEQLEEQIEKLQEQVNDLKHAQEDDDSSQQANEEDDDNNGKSNGNDKEKQDNGKHKGQEKNKNKGKK